MFFSGTRFKKEIPISLDACLVVVVVVFFLLWSDISLSRVSCPRYGESLKITEKREKLSGLERCQFVVIF